MTDDLLTVDEVAAITRVSRKTLDAWRHENYGPRWIPMGRRRIVYARSDVVQWISDQRDAATAS